MSKEEWTRERGKEPHKLSVLLMAHIGEIESLFVNGKFDLIRDDYDHYRKAADARTRAALESRSGKH